MRGHRVPLVSILLTLALACGGDKPLKPEPGELRIYIGGIDYSQPGPARSVLFVYDYDSLTVLDSMPLPAPSTDAVVSGDGRSLYVVTTNDLRTRSLWKIDPESKQAIWHHDLAEFREAAENSERVRLANGGRWLVHGGTVISAVDGKEVKTLTDDRVPFGGPASGTHVALGLIPDGRRFPLTLLGYDLDRDTTWGTYLPHLRSGVSFSEVLAADLHPDLRRVLAIGFVGLITRAWFVIGDLQSGETLYEKELYYPFGEIAISPDGTRAVVTDPSGVVVRDSPSTVDIFDLVSLTHLKRLTTGPGQIEIAALPGQIAWAPGMDAVVVGAPGTLSSAGGFSVVDVGKLAVTGAFYLPGRSEQFEYFTGGLAVGVAPPSH